MIEKEWREVGRQALFFFLALAGIILLAHLADRIQHVPFSGERAAIMMGLWLLMLSLFMGLSPFALDAKQKGMEYLLSLPLSRSRLLWVKFLPRLAAVVLFYLAFAWLYARIGHDAFGGGFAFFSLSYFALFLVSFSFSLVHENFVVQSAWAGAAWSVLLALCLLLVRQGFTWKFKMPPSRLSAGLWLDLGFDGPTLLAAVGVFLLMTLPFLLSFFLAFRKFDLKPARAFNRRQLRIFVPLLLPAFALSLGITWLVQGRPPFWGSRVFLLDGGRALLAEYSRKLTVIDGAARRTAALPVAAFWDGLLHEENGRLFLGGYDMRGGESLLGRLDTADMTWKLLHRCPDRELADAREFGFLHDGEGFVYLRRGRGAKTPARMNGPTRKGVMDLELVCLDRDGAVLSVLPFIGPPPRRNDRFRFIGADRIGGRRCWLVANPATSLLRLWQDGRVDDLGSCQGALPVFTRGLIFARGEGGLAVRRLSAAGADPVAEIPGRYSLDFAYQTETPGMPLDELYAESGGRIVRIDTATLAVSDVGPGRGLITLVAPGEFYYVEFESWPAIRASDAWKRLYRLQDGRMTLLKEFAFGDAGYGHLAVERHGVVLSQHQKGGKTSLISRRYFSFPDLTELARPE